MRKYVHIVNLLCITKRFASNQCKKKITSSEVLEIAEKHIVSTSSNIFPIVASKGKGASLFDVEGNEYLDFLSGQVGVILGHAHPKVSKAVAEQAWALTNTTRSLYTKVLVDFGQYITKFFCYDKVLNLDSDIEAVEAAVTLAKKWAKVEKGIDEAKAKIIIPENKKVGGCSGSQGPNEEPDDIFSDGSIPGFETVPYNDARALEFKLRDPEVCAFLFEPIETRSAIEVPDPCYLRTVRDMCCRHKVLMIADETECGLGVAGCWLCCNIYNIRPDILVLGKALTTGYTSMAVVMSELKIMDLVEPGTFKITSGTNPLGCRAGLSTLEALHEEKLIDNAKEMGELLREALCDLPRDIVSDVTGIGLINAIELASGVNAFDICCELMKNGLLVHPINESTLRLNPPLIIKEKHVTKAVRIIRRTLENSRGHCSGSAGPEKPEPPKKKISDSFSDILKCAKKCLKKDDCDNMVKFQSRLFP